MPIKNSILVACTHCGTKISRCAWDRKRAKQSFCSQSCKKLHIIPFLERVAKLTTRVGDCLIWNGSKNNRGYGLTSINSKTTYLTRAIWTYHNGPIPERLMVMHSCDTPACCELKHLSLGTAKDNIQDAARKGRMASGDRNISRKHPEKFQGEKNGRAVLTEWDVIAIRKSLEVGISRKAIANSFGVCTGSIYQIAQGRTWRSLLVTQTGPL